MTPKHLKRFIAAASFGLFAAFNAHADDPAAGATVFNNCTGSGCHNTTTPLTSNASKIYNARNARAWIQSNINSNNSGMGRLSGLTAQQVADVAAYLGNTPTSLTFGSTAVGSTAAAQTYTIYASLKSGYALSAISVSTSGDFARSGGTCGTTLAVGTSCTVLVSFTPTATGTRTGTLSISHNNTLTPIAIPLSGTATGGVAPAPVASISPASLSFGSTTMGATSAAQNVSVSNTGNAALTISAITSSNSADFVIAGGTCSAGGSVAAGASCTVSMAFAPAAGAAGTRSGSLSIAHNAAGSPGSVSLSGTAAAAAAPAALLTTSLAFGSVNVGSSSGVQTATLSNTGNAPLTIASLATGSTEFVITGGTCAAGGSVAAAASCTVNLNFTPSTAGARSATLTIAHNASGGQSTTSLSGTGVALTPAIGISPTTLNFTQTTGATSAAQTVTVSNTGNAPLSIGTVTLGGAQAAEFQLASGTTCTAGASVAANASCVIKVAFTPSTTGARSASITLTHNAAGSPATIALNGTGTATAQPAISLNATTLTFAGQTVGSASAAQSVTISNSGAATLTMSGLTLTGTAASAFSRGGSCTPTGTLAPGASCTVSFVFTPAAVGTSTATLTVASDAANGSAVLSLSGTGVPLATPAVTLAPTALAFGNQTTAVTSTARTATLTNSGSGALTLSGITASSGFGVVHNCGASVAAGASCTLSVVFTPTAVGAVSGSISIASNAAGSPQTLALSGTGVLASPVLAWLPATTALAFADASVGGASSTQTLTLSNQGPGAVTLQQFTLAGAQAADFSIGNGSTCTVNASLAQGASCTLALAFQPGAAGARSATLQVASTGTNPPDVALSGNGSALAQPTIGVVPSALSFTVTASATSADQQTLTLQNIGSAVLHVNAVRIASGSFTLATAAVNSCPTAPFDLMPGQSCAVAIGWSGTASAADTGAVEIDTGAAAPMQVALQVVRSATAAAPATMSNAGGGGCSISDGRGAFDPVLWLLTLLAACVLWRRRATR